jgi:hypothetical protein
VERIKAEEKKDRLAVGNIKKKRYGIGKLNKEENLRLKSRTEDRILLARGRENLWKKFRESKEDDTFMGEEEAKAWETVRSNILELEDGEDGDMEAIGEDKIRMMKFRKPVLNLKRGDVNVQVMDDVEVNEVRPTDLFTLLYV